MFDLRPTQGHDMFVAFGIKLLMDAYPSARILAVDCEAGWTMIDEAPMCPVLEGYRPDAIVALADCVVLLEAKSIADVGSERSLEQYRRVESLMSGNERLKFFLTVFGAPVGATSRYLALPTWMSVGDRVQVSVFSEKWVEEYETV